MTDIHIPPEAVEAAARAMCHNAYKHLPEMRDVDTYTPDADYWIAQATAAIRAALEAWPGRLVAISGAVILPLAAGAER